MSIRAYQKTDTAAEFVMPFGPATSQFAPPTAGEAMAWIFRDMTIYEGTICSALPPGVGVSWTLTFRNNTTNTGTPLVLSGAASDAIRGPIDAILPAALNAGTSESDISRVAVAGTPAANTARIAYFYLDDDDETRSVQGFGSATFNHGVSATPEYFSIESDRTTTSEPAARAVVPANGAFVAFSGRAGASTGDGVTELAIMINGVATVLGTFGAVTMFHFETNIPVVEGDEFSFRVRRISGTSTTFAISCAVAFAPTAS